MLPNRVVSIDEISDALETLLEEPMAEQLDKPETEETETGEKRARLTPDMKAMSAINRALDDLDEETASDVIEYIAKRRKRAAMIKEWETKR